MTDLGDEHINIKELRAYFAAARWRARALSGQLVRVVQILDSQVCIAVLVKGRSSSRKLQGVLRKVGAIHLAANQRPFFGYVHTADNPADKPPRWAALRQKPKHAKG